MNIYAMKKPKRINSVSVTLSLFGLVFLYAMWALLPVFWPLWQMSGIMRSACAQAYTIAKDEEVMLGLLKDAKRTKLRVGKENFLLQRGGYTDEELLDMPPTRREAMKKIGSECRLQFRYDATYKLPLIETEYRLPYSSEVVLDLRRNQGGGNTLNDFFYNSCTCTSSRRGG